MPHRQQSCIVNLSPLTVFLLSFVLGATGGLWAVLRNPGDLYLRTIISSSLGSGCAGLCWALISYERYGTQEFGQCTLVGVALLLGMGGQKTIEHILQAARNYLGKVESDDAGQS